ncbi:hypothetical protein [Oceaniglobus trochenteri]|uniref:hypothetical protein n=1 Tax=Oceaniglobus trochenteri TaxID=2763260 RepID=UPI001CFFFBD2|nr:hypothetical protein [Oceaniglobus trochenteri]
MVRASPPARSASSGEMSELMFGRPDFERYANGVRRLRGFIPLPEGPTTRCPGTEMIGETRNNGVGRLMGFVFRDEDAMLLEWTNGQLRFWRNGALVQDGGAPYSIATPYNATQAKSLQSLQSSDRIYLTGGGLRPQRLSRMAIDDWSIENTPFVGGPFAPRNLDQSIEISASAATGTVTLTATGDVFLADHVGSLFRLQETDSSATPFWTGNTETEIGDQYYHGPNLYEIVGFDAKNGTTGATAPTVDVDENVSADADVIWSAISNDNSGNVPDWTAGETVRFGNRRFSDGWTIEVIGFTASGRKTGVNPPVHIQGRVLTEKGGPVYEFVTDGIGIVEITAVAGPRSATAEVRKRLPDGLTERPTYRWSEAAWSDLRGWPRAIGAFQQRHCYGGTPMDPRTMWFSVIGGTVDMTDNGLEDDGFSYILASPRARAGEIRSILAAGETLHIFTSGDEFFGSATDADRAFAAETARFSSDTAHGAADVPPILIDGAPVFLHKNSRQLFAQMINPNSGKFIGENLTQIARHILGRGADRLVYQEDPVPVVWARGTDGALIGLTYLPGQKVVGFHRHDLAGGFVEDIEVLPSDDGLSEDLYLIVRRQINGQTRRFIERMKHPFIELDGLEPDLQDAWFQYCAVRYQGTATTEISGLDHLEGETVTAWTERGAFARLTVTGGAVTLPHPVTSAITGLDATDLQNIETLDIVMGTPDGGDEGRKRTHRVTGMRVHRTVGGRFSVIQTTSCERRETASQPIFNERAFALPSLRDGVVEIGGHKGWSHQTALKFTPDPGAPFTLVSRTPTLMVTDS